MALESGHKFLCMSPIAPSFLYAIFRIKIHLARISPKATCIIVVASGKLWQETSNEMYLAYRPVFHEYNKTISKTGWYADMSQFA